MEEKLMIENSKGLQLSTVIHRPNDDTRHPLILLLHGFTGYKEEENAIALAKELADHGYVAVQFDASGYGESEGTLEHDYRFSNYLNDIDIVYEYMKKQSYVDSTRIGLWGHSMGAMECIVFVSLHPEIKAIVPVSPAILMGTSDLLGHAIPEWKRTGWWEKTSSKYGKVRIPYAFIEDAQKYNVLEYAKKVHVPSLYILGTTDKTVNTADTKAVYEAANHPKKLIEIEGMDHFYKKHSKFIKAVNYAVVTFFDRTVK